VRVVDEKEGTAARGMIEKQAGVCETGETLFRHERDAIDEINQEGGNHVQKGQTGSKAGENTARGACLSDYEVGGKKEAVVCERARRTAWKRHLHERGRGEQRERGACVRERKMGGEKEALVWEEGKVADQERGFHHEREALVGEATGAKEALVGEKKALVGEKEALVDEKEALAGDKEALVWRMFEVLGTRKTLDVKGETLREAIGKKVELVVKDVDEELVWKMARRLARTRLG
jgi:hypothetical protein